MAESVERTLRTVASIGYREVELAGSFGHPPDELRGLLDELGLAAPAAHHGLDEFRGRLDGLLEDARVLGHRYLVLPWLPESDRTLDGYRRLAAEMNRIGEACRAAGFRLAYHNHAFEFERVEGVTPFDLLLAETDPALVRMELDLYWLAEGGGDPFAYFEAHPGRFELWHVKDRAADGRMVDVGAGAIDFASIFGAARAAGLEHFFVEHDAPAEPVASIRASYAHLADLQP